MKASLNLLAAMLFSTLAGWILYADITYPGSLLFSMSASIPVLLLFYLCLLTFAQIFAIIPKRFVLVSGILLTMRASYGYPLSLLTNIEAASILSSAALLIFTLYYVFFCMRRTELINARPWLSFRHSGLVFFGSTAIMLLSIPQTVFGLVEAIEERFGGYIEISHTGISILERVYEKDGQRVYLPGMMHIGESRYYDELAKRMKAPLSAENNRRLILTEGVSDAQKILHPDFASGAMYARWAGLFGLDVQSSFKSKASQLSAESTKSSNAQGQIVYLNADIDVSELTPIHRETLVAFIDFICTSDPLEFLASRPQGITGYDFERLLTDGLVIQRNDLLMTEFNQHAPAYSEIYIPWGAAHMPDIENRIKVLGYQLIAETENQVISFWKK
jgi:hypothetical protein